MAKFINYDKQSSHINVRNVTNPRTISDLTRI